jgi:7-cyano-7-deazaguanine synthase
MSLTPESRARSVVCLSGGMDSCVTTAMAASETEAYALHFSYGQRTESRELEAARAVADRLGLREFMHLRIDVFRRIGGSALTDATIDVPEASDSFREHGFIENEIPVTYVPFRNAHFLSAAVSWAEVLGATRVYIGAVEQDSSGYPDCRPEYYEAFQKLIDTGTRAGQGNERIRIVTPLISKSKAEIVRLGLECDAPLDLTWSCYREEREACGACESCVLRLRAFAAAGVADPIRYAATGDTTGR